MLEDRAYLIACRYIRIFDYDIIHMCIYIYVFDLCIVQAFTDWQAELRRNCTNRIVQQHRLLIAENILTLRCPRVTCRTAIVDFDGCFALTCSTCGCAFCAWCLKDCGADAHPHGNMIFIIIFLVSIEYNIFVLSVLECPESLRKGDYFAKISDFDYVHGRRREQEVLRYIRENVDESERSALKKAIEGDLADLGMSL
jgi:hypothetical protein